MTSYIFSYFFTWLSFTITFSIETICCGIAYPEDFYNIFSWLAWNKLNESTSFLEGISCSSLVTDSLRLYYFLQFEITIQNVSEVCHVVRLQTKLFYSSIAKPQKAPNVFKSFYRHGCFEHRVGGLISKQLTN